MNKPFNGLTDAQAERLAMLAEECGEVVQVVGKTLRHGYDSHCPGDPAKVTNRQLLTKEIGDVRHVVRMLCDAMDVAFMGVEQAEQGKAMRVGKYLHHQADPS